MWNEVRLTSGVLEWVFKDVVNSEREFIVVAKWACEWPEVSY